YPVGHPEIFLAGDPKMTPVEEWNGAVKCTVVPPRDLYLPVLPYKANGRLMFPLCRTCVEMQNQEICTHADPKQRQLCSVWCAPEIHLAMEKGYKIETVHEVYQYPRTMKWNGENGREGLLSAYVRCFMALKAQASGWPADCTSDEAKQKYMDDVKKYDGITIDPAKVEKNPVLRQLSKLMLNSFWGKFGEKTVRPKTDIVFDYAALIKIVSDPLKKVTGLIPRGDDCLQIVWQPIQETDRSLPTSSLIHAAFTTCHGRLQLYHYLDVVKERALYHDTDSICYISRPGEPELPLGTHPGDLTDQIEEDYGPGSFITEFVAGGPKNYAFKVAVGGDVKQIKVCIKVRGISINASCCPIARSSGSRLMTEASNRAMPRRQPQPQTAEPLLTITVKMVNGRPEIAVHGPRGAARAEEPRSPTPSPTSPPPRRRPAAAAPPPPRLHTSRSQGRRKLRRHQACRGRRTSCREASRGRHHFNRLRRALRPGQRRRRRCEGPRDTAAARPVGATEVAPQEMEEMEIAITAEEEDSLLNEKMDTE
ncbi:hypothetical protein KUF71_014280, partial [Frankliniella fusca]